MIADARVGEVVVAEGTVGPLRADRTGSLVVTSGHGDYYEPVRNQRMFTATNAVAGVAPGTVLSTTPPFSLWNPTGSGVYLGLVKAVMGYVSGTLGSGSIVFAQVTSQPNQPTGGTALLARNNMIGSSRTATGQAFTGSTLASTPLIFRPFCIVGAALATSVSFPTTAETVDDAAIVVAPGAVVCMQGVALAGTTPLVIFGITWEEVPI